MNIGLRTACDKDFTFARDVYVETMRWIIERLFGWDLAREDKNFAQFFKLDVMGMRISAPRNPGAVFLRAFVLDHRLGCGVLPP